MQQQQISQEQFMHMIVNDFMSSLIQSKQMMIIKTNNIYSNALSPIIDEFKYGVEHYAQEGKFRLQLWMYKDSPNEPVFRQVELKYEEILHDMIQYGGGSPLDVALRMYDTLRNISQKDWDSLMETLENQPIEKPKIIL